MPLAVFCDSPWGYIDGDDYSIEVSLGEKEPVESLTFHVRGNSEETVSIVAKILQHLGLRAIDTQSGEFFDPEKALTSFRQWRNYRDFVIGR